MKNIKIDFLNNHTCPLLLVNFKTKSIMKLINQIKHSYFHASFIISCLITLSFKVCLDVFKTQQNYAHKGY